MIIILDESLKPLACNNSATGFFGPSIYSASALLKTLHLDAAELGSSVSKTIEIDGRKFSLRLYPLCEPGQRCIIVLRDITKEAELEDKLRRAEKLASLGIMAGGIAHEVNNPLSPIIGYSEVLYELEADEKKREYIRQIMISAQRIEKVVKDLLFFAKEQALKIDQVNIENLVNDVIQTLNSVRPVRDIRMIKELQYKGPVGIDRGLFEIALVNLLKNAVQAIEESNKGDMIKISSSKENGLIVIGVSDNGPGIPKDLLPYVFDPFVTTKGFGKGTGLGLSIVHRIVIAHRGEITVKSKENEGTTFIIRIPEHI